MRIEDEFLEVELGDERLNNRIRSISTLIESNHGGSILSSCDDWKTAKSAYRFLDNQRFTEQDIIEPHLKQTARRIEESGKVERILVIHDTTEFNHTTRKGTEGLGYLTGHELNKVSGLSYTQGLLMHASLAITDSGVPLGLLCLKQWTRDIKNIKKIRKHGKNFTRIPIEEKESYKWIEGVEQSCRVCDPKNLVHVCDRDGDLYELFDSCSNLETTFVVRAVHSRSTVKSSEKSFSKLNSTSSSGTYTLKIQSSPKRKARQATIEVRFYQVELIPPIAKKQICKPTKVWVVSAKERSNKKIQKSDLIHWKLLTNDPIKTLEDSLRCIRWYQARWNIELFFKTIKSGFGLEKCRLRHATRIKKFTALVCVVAWRIFWTTRISRSDSSLEPLICYTKKELRTLNKLEIKAGREALSKTNNLQLCTIALARLGGYLARKNDPPPGDIVIWRGFLQLNDIMELQ